LRPRPSSPLFPYTTLFRSEEGGGLCVASCVGALQRPVNQVEEGVLVGGGVVADLQVGTPVVAVIVDLHQVVERHDVQVEFEVGTDRKSTRLNSSHVSISYA